jgi:hypothetical protein
VPAKDVFSPDWGHTTDGKSYSQRLHLWHKVTEKVTPNQERCQSSGWFDNLKLTTSGPKGCLHRVFDLNHDPYVHITTTTTTLLLLALLLSTTIHPFIHRA